MNYVIIWHHPGFLFTFSGLLAIKLWYVALLHFCTPPIVIDDSSWKNAAESFTVALTLTLGGTKVQ